MTKICITMDTQKIATVKSWIGKVQYNHEIKGFISSVKAAMDEVKTQSMKIKEYGEIGTMEDNIPQSYYNLIIAHSLATGKLKLDDFLKDIRH